MMRKIREKQWGFKAIVNNYEKTEVLKKKLGDLDKIAKRRILKKIKDNTLKRKACGELFDLLSKQLKNTQKTALEKLKLNSSEETKSRNAKLSNFFKLIAKSHQFANIFDKIQAFYRLKQVIPAIQTPPRDLSIAYIIDSLHKNTEKNQLESAFRQLKMLLKRKKGLLKLIGMGNRKILSGKDWAWGQVSRFALKKLRENQQKNSEDRHDEKFSKENLHRIGGKPVSDLKSFIDLLQKKALKEPFEKIHQNKRFHRMKKIYSLFDKLGYKLFLLLSNGFENIKRAENPKKKGGSAPFDNSYVKEGKPVENDEITKPDTFRKNIHKDDMIFKSSLALSPITQRLHENVSTSPYRVKPLKPSTLAEKLKGKPQDPYPQDGSGNFLGNTIPKEKRKGLKDSLAGTNDESGNLNRIDDLLAKSKAKLKDIYENILGANENKENKNSFHFQSKFCVIF